MTSGNTRFYLKRKCEQIVSHCETILGHLQYMVQQYDAPQYTTHKAMVMKMAEIGMMLHECASQMRRLV